jgi:vacuolar-type H+-ATPase subunit H
VASRQERSWSEELARILAAEAEARRVVDDARAEARRIQAAAQRQAQERIDRAHAASARLRAEACAQPVADAEVEAERILARSFAEREALAAGARPHLDEAAAAALAVLLGEVAW